MSRPMNRMTLDVIIAVQRFKSLALSELPIFPDRSDWPARTEEYYLSLPLEVMQQAGLKRNRFDFERIIYTFVVTPHMMNCLFDQLHHFDFDRVYGPDDNPVPQLPDPLPNLGGRMKEFVVGDACWIHAGGEGNPLVEAKVEHIFDIWRKRHFVVSLQSPLDPILEIRDLFSISDDPTRPIGLFRR